MLQGELAEGLWPSSMRVFMRFGPSRTCGLGLPESAGKSCAVLFLKSIHQTPIPSTGGHSLYFSGIVCRAKSPGLQGGGIPRTTAAKINKQYCCRRSKLGVVYSRGLVYYVRAVCYIASSTVGSHSVNADAAVVTKSSGEHVSGGSSLSKEISVVVGGNPVRGAPRVSL